MKCVKCGKTIQSGSNRLCSDCQKKFINELNSEESIPSKKNRITKKEKFNVFDIIFLVICIIIIIVSLSVTTYTLVSRRVKLEKSKVSSTDNLIGKTIGNTVPNIRYYGYCAMEDDWIYYYTSNEDFSTGRICKIKNNGSGKKIIFEESNMSIYSINAINGYIYFIGVTEGEYSQYDDTDNKIYRMRNDGSDLEVINNNALDNYNNYLYVIKDKVYFSGIDGAIWNMDLDGENFKTITQGYEVELLGVTDKYIIFDKYDESSGEKVQTTYVMDLDGNNQRPLIPGKKLSNISVENEYVYYIGQNGNICRTKIDSNKEELVSDDTVYILNVYGNRAYYFAYTSEDNTQLGIWQIDLLDKTFTPKLIRTLRSSYYMDIVRDYANFLDVNDKYVSVNLFKTDGSLNNIELFTYNNVNIDGNETEATNINE